METRVVKVTADNEAEAAASAARDLQAGALVGFATETVYGIAAMATRSSAMERLRELKSRPSRPFSVHVAKAAEVGRYVKDIPAAASRLISKGWPGPVTVLLETGGRLADEMLQRDGLYEGLCSEGVIGLRCPEPSVSRAMLEAAGEPVVAPSANLAGQPSPRTAQEVLESLHGRIDLLLDSGPAKFGKDSTIVRFKGDGWEVVREGVYDKRTVKKLMERVLVFVCTGNTCRSPMAAGLARAMLSQRLGCAAGDLELRGMRVVSAGLAAGSQGRATPEAVGAAGALGADISRHRTQKVTIELINQADVVFCMTEFQVAEIRRLAPWAKDKVRRLDPSGDVEDPIGSGADSYVETAKQIQSVLQRLPEITEL